MESIEEVDEGVDSLRERAKFPSQKGGNNVKCQTYDNKRDADIEWKGEQKNV